MAIIPPGPEHKGTDRARYHDHPDCRGAYRFFLPLAAARLLGFRGRFCFGLAFCGSGGARGKIARQCRPVTLRPDHQRAARLTSAKSIHGVLRGSPSAQSGVGRVVQTAKRSASPRAGAARSRGPRRIETPPNSDCFPGVVEERYSLVSSGTGLTRASKLAATLNARHRFQCPTRACSATRSAHPWLATWDPKRYRTF
jgi:hypothetical protein